MQFEEIQPLAVTSFENSTFIGVCGHKMVCDQEGDGIYFVGGWNPNNFDNPQYFENDYVSDVWKFSMAARTWTQLRSDDPPGFLASHKLVNLGRTINNGPSRLLVFGGNSLYSRSGNDAYVYDVRDDRWEKLVTSGPSPAMGGHGWFGQALAKDGAYVYVATAKYIFDPEDMGCVEIHRLNLHTFVWEELSVRNPDAPECSVGRDVVIDDDKIYMIGCHVADCIGGFFGLVHIPSFDIITKRWKVLCSLPDPHHGYPKDRNCFGCVKYEGNVYITGGRAFYHDCEADPKDVIISMSDVWRLDLKTGQWCKLPISLPRPLWFHSADVDRDGVLYVFGGCPSGNFDSEWTTQLWRTRLVVQPLKRLAWDKIISCVSHEVISSDSKLLDVLPLPPGFVNSKVKW